MMYIVYDRKRGLYGHNDGHPPKFATDWYEKVWIIPGTVLPD